MNLDDILSQAGKYKKRKRVGRGSGSGMGKTSGRGHKGAGSRAGASARYGFEGGQNPAIARLPKRGFNNARFKNSFQVVNLDSLEAFEEGATVDAEALVEARLIRDVDKPVKILGNGQIDRKLTVVANKFSQAAAKKIEDAGGQAKVV